MLIIISESKGIKTLQECVLNIYRQLSFKEFNIPVVSCGRDGPSVSPVPGFLPPRIRVLPSRRSLLSRSSSCRHHHLPSPSGKKLSHRPSRSSTPPMRSRARRQSHQPICLLDRYDGRQLDSVESVEEKLAEPRWRRE